MPPHITPPPNSQPARSDPTSHSPVIADEVLAVASPPSSWGRYRDDPTQIAPIRIDVASAPAVRDRQIALAVGEICPDAFFPPSPDPPSPESHASSSSSSSNAARGLSIEKLGGGLSNHLFVVSREGSASPPVLLRVHCEDGEDGDGAGGGFVDREAENRSLALLSARGMAPIFHGRFENGRVEEFYGGYRTLSWEEMSLPRFAGPVAAAMAALHRIDAPAVFPYEDGAVPAAGGGGRARYGVVSRGGSGSPWERTEEIVAAALLTTTRSNGGSRGWTRRGRCAGSGPGSNQS